MDLKNRFITKASFGFSLGIFIGILITAVSTTLSVNDGNIYMYNTLLASRVGNLLLSFCLELLCYGVLGAVGMGGVVLTYENDGISLLKATVLHFVFVMVTFTSVGLYLGWFDPSDWIANTIFVTCFIVAYVIIWAIQSSIYKKEIKEINQKIEKMKRSDV